ncbi:hypothetical protein Tco_0210628 [Tanacetum coccineum]
MSADSAVTYTSIHSEARSWSIPSEDPYEEAARQLLEQAPCSPEYVPDPMELKDHVPVYISEPEHPEDLVPAEDEAPIEAYITEVAFAPPPPPSFLPSRIRPPRTRAAMAQMRAAAPSKLGDQDHIKVFHLVLYNISSLKPSHTMFHFDHKKFHELLIHVLDYYCIFLTS